MRYMTYLPCPHSHFLRYRPHFEQFFMPTANLDPKSSPTPSPNINQPLTAHPAKPSRWQLAYDTIMMVAIVLDLLLMGFDALMLSSFMAKIASWLGFLDSIISYQQGWHEPLKVAGGLFTIFLIAELLVRWLIAIAQKRYYRWFFFPFVHWYEVLGCAPQLRALRLLRVGVIGYRLHELGYKVLPASWLATIKFYYQMIMEEISDRVILTAIDNIRTEISNTDGHLVKNIIDKHRDDIQKVIVEVLQQEATPLLQSTPANPAIFAKPLAEQVGIAIQQALTDTPELHRILRLIPIAGSLIENQMHSIGQHIGENLTLSLTTNLTKPQTLTLMYEEIAKSLVQIDVTSPALEKLVSDIIDDSLTSLANQVRIQQWKHQIR